eukprot:TRINITY_DN10319_c0_g3_i1.p1 TRINITY_DN10319_c0_g3~~TRINITY_DN10319_c0_g3_i1.p1  ORF type:complete len:279 (-),score=40.95 TRINITY_DN10319_c0_g3_i1:117-953(-)
MYKEGKRRSFCGKLLVAATAALSLYYGASIHGTGIAFVTSVSSSSSSSASRRDVIFQMFTAAGAAASMPSEALAETEKPRLAVVEKYPPRGTLVPLVGFLNLAERTAQAGNSTAELWKLKQRWRKVQDIDTDSYTFVCGMYIATFQYNDTDEIIKYDKAFRKKVCDNAMGYMGQTTKIFLRAAKPEDLDAPKIQEYIGASIKYIKSYLAIVPEEDVRLATVLSEKMRPYDSDHQDHRLTDEELLAEPEEGDGKIPWTEEDKEIVGSLIQIGARSILIP